MTGDHRHFVLLGGDRRMELLAELLAAEGREVRLFRDGRPDGPLPGDAVLILPLPALDGAGRLNVRTGEGPRPEELFRGLAPGTPVLAGAVNERLAAAAREAGVTLRDYAAGEAFAAANAVPTAEGAIAAAMEALDVTLCGAKAAVAGAGRIGKLLALRLRALGARVTLTARKPADLAWAEALGAAALPAERLAEALCGADVAFNTVPAPVFGAAEFAALGEGTPLLELASAPGGAAPEFRDDPRILRLPGLPGKAAPRTAARAIRDAVLRILKEDSLP